MESLKVKLTYYEECNEAGLEMFRNWAKSKNLHKTTTLSAPRFGGKPSI